MNYTLHYAPLSMNGDVIEKNGLNKTQLKNLIGHLTIGKNDTVFLLAFEDIDGESIILVFDRWKPFLEHTHFLCYSNVFLQEYSSYEEAYKVALEMKEESPLCYS